MQISKPHKFLMDWGFHAVMVAVTLPVLGLAYLAWTWLPTQIAAHPAPAPSESVRWRSMDVIGAFHVAGLNAEVIRGESKDERDGLSTFTVFDTRRFRISEKDKEMGMVLSFENAKDLQQMQKYFEGLNRSLPQFRSWLFVKDNILLQINHEVPERQARAYAAILETLDQ